LPGRIQPAAKDGFELEFDKLKEKENSVQENPLNKGSAIHNLAKVKKIMVQKNK